MSSSKQTTKYSDVMRNGHQDSRSFVLKAIGPNQVIKVGRAERDVVAIVADDGKQFYIGRERGQHFLLRQLRRLRYLGGAHYFRKRFVILTASGSVKMLVEVDELGLNADGTTTVHDHWADVCDRAAEQLRLLERMDGRNAHAHFIRQFSEQAEFVRKEEKTKQSTESFERSTVGKRILAEADLTYLALNGVRFSLLGIRARQEGNHSYAVMNIQTENGSERVFTHKLSHLTSWDMSEVIRARTLFYVAQSWQHGFVLVRDKLVDTKNDGEEGSDSG